MLPQDIIAGLQQTPRPSAPGSAAAEAAGPASEGEGDAAGNLSKAKAAPAAAAATAALSAPFQDLSVHLCFICLLHLANEHGLALSNHGRLDELSVSRGSGASASH